MGRLSSGWACVDLCNRNPQGTGFAGVAVEAQLAFGELENVVGHPSGASYPGGMPALKYKGVNLGVDMGGTD